MLRLLLDENLRAESLWTTIQDLPAETPIDVVRVGDAGGPVLRIDDTALLDWAAADRRILISFDRRTLPERLRKIVNAGGHSPGIVFLARRLSPAEMAEYIHLIASSSSADEWADTYRFIP